jgi:hypothetical protein
MRFLRQCERCEKPRARLLPCGHIVHYKCLVARTRCPTCNVSVDKSNKQEVTNEDNLKSVLQVTKKRQQQAGRKFGVLLYQFDAGSKVRVPLLDVLLELDEHRDAPDFANFLATQLTQVLEDDDNKSGKYDGDNESIDLGEKPCTPVVKKPIYRKRFQVFDTLDNNTETQLLPTAPLPFPDRRAPSKEKNQKIF